MTFKGKLSKINYNATQLFCQTYKRGMEIEQVDCLIQIETYK